MEKDFNQLRSDLRQPDVLRPVAIQTDFMPQAAGSVLMEMGNTRVLCAVSVEENIPRWMREQKVKGGWITAEYRMLPYAGGGRKTRECTAGRIGGRTQEIQRLIGRALRASVDLQSLGSRTLWVDCDVLQADGGTRTASVTGALVALRLATARLLEQGLIDTDPVHRDVAAVSVGRVNGRALLDLCYEEDAAADVDMNVVMMSDDTLVEVQGTAEGHTFSRDEMNELLDLAAAGIRDLFRLQREALERARKN